MLTSKSKSNRGGLKLPSAWMPLSVVCDSPNNHLPPIHWNEFNATTSTHRHTVVKFWLEKVVKSLNVLKGFYSLSHSIYHIRSQICRTQDSPLILSTLVVWKYTEITYYFFSFWGGTNYCVCLSHQLLGRNFLSFVFS